MGEKNGEIKCIKHPATTQTTLGAFMKELEKNIKEQLKIIERLINAKEESVKINKEKAILDKLLEEYVKRI